MDDCFLVTIHEFIHPNKKIQYIGLYVFTKKCPLTFFFSLINFFFSIQNFKFDYLTLNTKYVVYFFLHNICRYRNNLKFIANISPIIFFAYLSIFHACKSNFSFIGFSNNIKKKTIQETRKIGTGDYRLFPFSCIIVVLYTFVKV